MKVVAMVCLCFGLGCSDPAFDVAAANPNGAVDGGPVDAPGAGTSCTNMEQCAADGLVCISHAVEGCTEGACLRRYSCEPHPAADTCTGDPLSCIDIHCVTLTDCPSGSNFCVGEMFVDGKTPPNAVGLFTSHCSAGTPASEPKDPGVGGVVVAYLCTHDGDCVIDDGGTGKCCPTAIGLGYCASECSAMK